MSTDETLATEALPEADETPTIEAILDAFASAADKRALPRAAMEQAIARWQEVGPVLLAALEEAVGGPALSDSASWILCFAIHLIAQLRDTRAFRPLCALAADADRLETIMADGMTEDLAQILARLYDGDPAPLRRVIEAGDADPYAREAAVSALAWLTVTGRIDQAETASYLRDLYTTLQPRGGNMVWFGWQQAIANLGLEELAPQVEDAFRLGWVDPTMLELRDFHDDLQISLRASDKQSVFDSRFRPAADLDDAVDYLSEWNCFQPKPPARSRPDRLPPEFAGSGRGMGNALTSDALMDDPYLDREPYHNPYRGIGRNDPCPCGSGRKFKKCCLDKAQAGAGPLS
jgi:hypothetical protein